MQAYQVSLYDSPTYSASLLACTYDNYMLLPRAIVSSYQLTSFKLPTDELCLQSYELVSMRIRGVHLSGPVHPRGGP